MPGTDGRVPDAVQDEFDDFHEFLNLWFTGKCEESDALFEERHASHLAQDFQIILPDGSAIARAPFITYLRDMYGSNPGFKKHIRNIELRSESGAGCLLVNYQEWQKNARNTVPANHGRMVSAVLKVRSSGRGGLEWLQIHETMLPSETIAAEQFDF